VDDLTAGLYASSIPTTFSQLAREFDYQNGRTDIVGIGQDDCIYAFEAKLVKWRQAIDQAYRNTCFAHYSYVALPEPVALRALECRSEFERRHVGLFGVSGSALQLYISAVRNEPILEWVADNALRYVKEYADE